MKTYVLNDVRMSVRYGSGMEHPMPMPRATWRHKPLIEAWNRGNKVLFARAILANVLEDDPLAEKLSVPFACACLPSTLICPWQMTEEAVAQWVAEMLKTFHDGTITHVDLGAEEPR